MENPWLKYVVTRDRDVAFRKKGKKFQPKKLTDKKSCGRTKYHSLSGGYSVGASVTTIASQTCVCSVWKLHGAFAVGAVPA